MARFMLVWELGGGLGHAVPLTQIAGALLRRGHEVHLVWKDLSVCQEALGSVMDSPRLHLWQAPVWLPVLNATTEPTSHAEILFGAGFLDPGRLTGNVLAWRQLFANIRPDLLLADHAPTAMLASRGLDFKRALIGNGFFIPPARSPIPSFRDWEPVAAERVAASESRVLSTCNAVLDSLGNLGMARLTALREVFEADELFMLGWPELDHLRALREGEPPRSWGYLPAPVQGLVPVWPRGNGQRIFGYLKREHPAVDAMLARLRAGHWCCLAYVSGLSAEDAARLGNDQLRVLTQLVDMRAVLTEAELVLSLGSAGTVYSTLAAGIPSVILPLQVEQLLLARRVAAVGAGVFLWPQEVEAGLGQAIDAVLGSPGFRTTARAFAARNGAAAHGDVLERITERCEALANAQ